MNGKAHLQQQLAETRGFPAINKALSCRCSRRALPCSCVFCFACDGFHVLRSSCAPTCEWSRWQPLTGSSYPPPRSPAIPLWLPGSTPSCATSASRNRRPLRTARQTTHRDHHTLFPPRRPVTHHPQPRLICLARSNPLTSTGCIHARFAQRSAGRRALTRQAAGEACEHHGRPTARRPLQYQGWSS